MDGDIRKMTRLRGVGPVLGRRFVEAGLDGFEKIVEAGEGALREIRGLNPRLISSILSQAAGMCAAAENTRESYLQEMQRRIDCIEDAVRAVASRVQTRFGSERQGTRGKRVEKEIFRILALLEKITVHIGTRKKRTAKGLERAEKRLLFPDEAGLKEIGAGLKRSRKSLEGVFS